MNYVVYTDGACKGNPGPGGYGFVILQDGQVLKEGSGGSKKTTNNRMELAAAVVALRSLPIGALVTLHTDSKYVQQGITSWVGGWRARGWKTAKGEPVKNKEIWQQLYDLDFHREVTWKWVKGHAGNKWNERCDELAVSACPRR